MDSSFPIIPLRDNDDYNPPVWAQEIRVHAALSWRQTPWARPGAKSKATMRLPGASNSLVFPWFSGRMSGPAYAVLMPTVSLLDLAPRKCLTPFPRQSDCQSPRWCREKREFSTRDNRIRYWSVGIRQLKSRRKNVKQYNIYVHCWLVSLRLIDWLLEGTSSTTGRFSMQLTIL